jgi:hypothetical protein
MSSHANLRVSSSTNNSEVLFKELVVDNPTIKSFKKNTLQELKAKIISFTNTDNHELKNIVKDLIFVIKFIEYKVINDHEFKNIAISEIEVAYGYLVRIKTIPNESDKDIAIENLSIFTGMLVNKTVEFSCEK